MGVIHARCDAKDSKAFPHGKPLVDVAGAPLVMLAASLPISFAGWGIRELSAAAAFQAIGAPPEAGITLGVGIGLLSILGLLLNVIGASLLFVIIGSCRQAGHNRRVNRNTRANCAQIVELLDPVRRPRPE